MSGLTMSCPKCGEEGVRVYDAGAASWVFLLSCSAPRCGWRRSVYADGDGRSIRTRAELALIAVPIVLVSVFIGMTIGVGTSSAPDGERWRAQHLQHKRDWVTSSKIPDDQKISADDWNGVVDAITELRAAHPELHCTHR